jgi:VanZ family protein
MKAIPPIVPRWFPAILMMGLIFAFSSRPGDQLPDFMSWDYLIKKSSHMLGYGLLALSFYRLLEGHPRRYRLAWLLAVLYAMTDEFHQSFVPGRSATILDVIVFDNLGAMLTLWLKFRFHR